MFGLEDMLRRYRVSRSTVLRWRKLHGQNTSRTGQPTSIPPEEWQQLDRYYVLTSYRPWGFRFSTKRYAAKFLDCDVFDEETGELLDYFERVDRYLLATKKLTFDQYLESIEWQSIFGN